MVSRKSKSLQRRPGRLSQRSRFLIYVEGSVSETLYIRGMRSDLGRRGPNITLGSTRGEPLGLVREALRHREREQGDSFDQVWCVFDVESPDPHASLSEAIALAHRNGIKCGITNPCFELWLILHFEQCRRWLTSEQACVYLESLPCDYDKDAKSFDYAKCRSLLQDAMGRADALAAAFDAHAPIADKNPWTSVQVLFREVIRASVA